IFEVGKPCARLVRRKLGQAEIPQALLARFRLQLAHERRLLPARDDMIEPGVMARQHFLVEERLQAAPPLLGPHRQIEIHTSSPLLTTIALYRYGRQISFRYIDKYQIIDRYSGNGDDFTCNRPF